MSEFENNNIDNDDKSNDKDVVEIDNMDEIIDVNEPDDSNIKKKKNNNFNDKNGMKKVVVYAVIFGIVAGFIIQGMNFAGNYIIGKKTTTDNSAKIQTTKAISSAPSANSVVDVASECLPAIVSITNMSIQEVQSFEGFFYGGGKQEYEQKSCGSGIIVGQTDDEILIATNNHVIEGAKTLTVSFYGDDENPVEALQKGSDSDKDLAVIAVKTKSVNKDTLASIKVATLGDSTAVQVGEQAIAIGNSLGYGTTVTSGIISATNRKINTAKKSEDSIFTQSQDAAQVNSTFLQTDAAINPGNSGGALLNSKGEVIGINSAKIIATEAEGVGYAIPISDAKPIIDELMAKKTRTVVDEKERGYLGISCKEIDTNTASVYGMPKGIYIASVNKNLAADKAGLQKGDIITKVDGNTVSTVEDVQSKLSYFKIDEKIKITYSRMDSSGEYKESTIEVKLSKASN